MSCKNGFFVSFSDKIEKAATVFYFLLKKSTDPLPHLELPHPHTAPALSVPYHLSKNECSAAFLLLCSGNDYPIQNHKKGRRLQLSIKSHDNCQTLWELEYKSLPVSCC